MESYSIQEYNDFDWKSYKALNPFLYIHGLRTQEEYEKNYIYEGRYLGRHYDMKYKKSQNISCTYCNYWKTIYFSYVRKFKRRIRKARLSDHCI